MTAYAFIVLGAYFCGGTASVDETRNKKIGELEQQKSKLYLQINSAIDDSMKTLLKANDTEGSMGLEYLRDLKEHVRELNGSDVNLYRETEIDLDDKSDLENRRSFKGLDFLKKVSHSRGDPFDFEAVLKPKKISAKDWKEMVTNRVKMQQKLDEWILERQKAKERLEKIRLEKKRLVMTGKYEKCPRFGYEGKKKKIRDNAREKSRYCKIKSMDSDFEKCMATAKDVVKSRQDDIRSSSSKKHKYPCCRKCCKKSYMGCL